MRLTNANPATGDGGVRQEFLGQPASNSQRLSEVQARVIGAGINNKHAVIRAEIGQSPANPLIGIEVRLPDSCKCGCEIALIGAGKAMHAGSLHCRACDRHRGWILRDSFDSIAAIVTQWGRPDTPITVRRGSSLPAAS
jgi:hypothetical protein